MGQARAAIGEMLAALGANPLPRLTRPGRPGPHRRMEPLMGAGPGCQCLWGTAMVACAQLGSSLATKAPGLSSWLLHTGPGPWKVTETGQTFCRSCHGQALGGRPGCWKQGESPGFGAADPGSHPS